ncbi:MAG: efflux RND transporter periplasmic adaptor subunit [Pseudomonadota bacterium]
MSSKAEPTPPATNAPTGPSRLKRVAYRAGTALVTLAFLGLAGAAVVTGSGWIAANAVGLEVGESGPEPVTVRTHPITVETSFETRIEVLGTVEAPRAQALGFEAGGTLAEVLVDEGDLVAEGTVLARQDTEALAADRAVQMAARDALLAEEELAALTAERQRQLAAQSHVSEQRYDEARLALTRVQAEVRRVEAGLRAIDVAISKTEIRAPFAGRVGARQADEGARLGGGTPVLTLFEDARRSVRAGLPEDLAEDLTLGDTLDVRIGDTVHRAEIIRLRPDIDTATRTRDALLALPDGVAPPEGALARVALVRDEAGRGIWVPISSLSEGIRGLWTLYYVTDGSEGPVLNRDAVELLHVEGGQAFVAGTFPENARLVADGTHRLSVGQPVVETSAGPEA